MAKYTTRDIKRIASSLRRQKEDRPNAPYQLLTGAGCSLTAGIPLASSLVKEINEKYKLECQKQLNEDELKDYGKCMGVLTINERKSLLGPYLEKSGVNWAHLAIASMMKAGFIGRVLTFNFDSILARACGLLGMYPATYDFVSGVTTRTDYISPEAILHLHG